MIVNSGELKDALTVASKWVPPKPVIQETGGYLVEWENLGALSISAFDPLGSDITLYLDGEGEDAEFSLVVPAKVFGRTAITMSKIAGNIELVASKSGLLMKCGNHETRIPTMDADGFPTLYTTENITSETTVDSLVFVEAVSAARGAAQHDNPFANLGSVFIGNGDAVSTDGMRMIIKRGFHFLDESVLIPVKFCAWIESALAKITGDVKVTYNSGANHILFTWDGGRASSSLVESSYPEYEQMIPNEYSSTFVFDRTDLQLAVDMSLTFSADSNNLLMFRTDNDVAILEAVSESGDHVSQVEPLEMDSEGIKLGMSCKFLADAIARIDGDIFIGMNGPAQIIIVHNDNDFIYGIMPMHVS